MDGARLEILWSNLRAIVTEQSKVLQRTAFSPIVREAGDHASALFDTSGRMIAQADIGTPGHINSLAFCGAHLIKLFPPSELSPGDLLITNDPWLGAGHLFDVTILAPIYHDSSIVGFTGSTIHHTDVGGYGHGAGARDVYEEGLWIPPMKLYHAGVPDRSLHAIIQQNVRVPDQVFGDLAAQISGTRVAAERITSMLDRQKLGELDSVGAEILVRSEEAMRNTIRRLRSGTYHGESQFTVPGGATVTLKAAVTVDNRFGDIVVDFAGSSPQSELGINVVMNYTHAYSSFAVRACLAPDLPNNSGSLAPIRVTAPKGSIVNCVPPCPVNARHAVGMYVPMPIMKALYSVAPDRILAESAGAPWPFHIHGHWADGSAFPNFMFASAGGMGARAGKPGLSATGFPTGVSAIPLEILEAKAPIVFLQRELRRGSRGRGRYAGGDGQSIKFRLRTKQKWILNASTGRTGDGPEGIEGGEPGKPGVFFVDGQAVNDVKKIGSSGKRVGVFSNFRALGACM
ncbi:MAG: hydantoinase B/oxoprolinase family protein [Alphaproteobacteria bacterium]|nr:hydantoinase B/oxoprolinase family protein [Alphaproteobacteria bacterium]